MCMRTCAGAIKQAQEIINVVVQLEHVLHKLTYAHLVGLLEAMQDIDSQIFAVLCEKHDYRWRNWDFWNDLGILPGDFICSTLKILVYGGDSVWSLTTTSQG